MLDGNVQCEELKVFFSTSPIRISTEYTDGTLRYFLLIVHYYKKKLLDREWVIYCYSFDRSFLSCQLWSWVRDGTRSLFCAHSHPPPIHSSSNVSHLPVPYFVGQPTLYLIACLEEGIWILSQKLFCNRKPCPLIKVWSTLLSLEALPGVVKSLPLATLIVPSTQYKSCHFFPLKISKFFSDRGVDRHPWQPR